MLFVDICVSVYHCNMCESDKTRVYEAFILNLTRWLQAVFVVKGKIAIHYVYNTAQISFENLNMCSEKKLKLHFMTFRMKGL